MTDPSPCVQNGTEHQFFYVNKDGSTQPTNKCQVEGCEWFTAVERPKKRRAPRTKRSKSGTGLEDLLNFGNKP
jgi:hypothetical protein